MSTGVSLHVLLCCVYRSVQETGGDAAEAERLESLVAHVERASTSYAEPMRSQLLWLCAALRGDASAQYAVAHLFNRSDGFVAGDRRGDGFMAPNDELAVWFLKSAARRGHASAQYTCGEAYLNPSNRVDFPNDHVKARTWLRRAAAQGNVDAKALLEKIEVCANPLCAMRAVGICGGCRVHHYCSVACQRQMRRAHRPSCRMYHLTRSTR